MNELDKKLEVLKDSINQTIDQKIKEESSRLSDYTRSLIDNISIQVNEKLKEVKKESNEACEVFMAALKKEKEVIASLQSSFQKLKDECTDEVYAIKSRCSSIFNQVVSLDAQNRRKSFVVRNFPESSCNVGGKTVSSCLEAVSSLADFLDLSDEMINIREAHRIGKQRDDGKPRLILVKTTEMTARHFLRKSRLLKQAPTPLCRVFIQEDLPPEINNRLAEMRKRAFEYRTKNPKNEAYVKNKKLYIDGKVVDEIVQNF